MQGRKGFRLNLLIRNVASRPGDKQVNILSGFGFIVWQTYCSIFTYVFLITDVLGKAF